MKTKNKMIIIFFVIALLIIGFQIYKPVSRFLEFHLDYYHRFWLSKNYNEVKNINVWDSTSYKTNNNDKGIITQYGNPVNKNGILFCSKKIAYCPKTKIWVTGIYGVVNSGAHLGFYDTNKYANANNSMYPTNFALGYENGDKIDYLYTPRYCIIDINEKNLNNGTFKIRVYLPDMSEYDEVSIKVKTAQIVEDNGKYKVGSEYFEKNSNDFVQCYLYYINVSTGICCSGNFKRKRCRKHIRKEQSRGY